MLSDRLVTFDHDQVLVALTDLVKDERIILENNIYSVKEIEVVLEWCLFRQ